MMDNGRPSRIDVEDDGILAIHINSLSRACLNKQQYAEDNHMIVPCSVGGVEAGTERWPMARH